MDPKRILLVDDDLAVVASLGGALERLGGYVVRIETRSQRAVEAAREFAPDLILLDVVMPGGDGGEVAAELAKDPSLKDVPIAFLTGLISQDEVDESHTDARGRRLIPKPIEQSDLLLVVRELLAPR